MFTFPLLLTIYAGFVHAFEADHLLAVGNIVSQRNKLLPSLKDGICWGLGHASTILLMGVLMILCRVNIPANAFPYFECLVGGMLILLALYRLFIFFKKQRGLIHTHAHQHTAGGHQHIHAHTQRGHHTHEHGHLLAYGTGLVHGLAGSGALLFFILPQMKSPAGGLIYLLIFGAGCIGGMLLAAGLFSIPFSKKIMQAQWLQAFLIIVSSALCLLYGGKVIIENLPL